MVRLVRTDRSAVSGSAVEGGWRLGGVRCARLWVLVCVVASLVAAVPASARAADVVYWANDIGNTISFANLDGSGGGDLDTTPATVDNPFGLALDPAAGRIYWANRIGDRISFANLDGSGGRDLDTTGAMVAGPSGVALDPAAGRIYWANSFTDTISSVGLDGSGGGGLVTTGATVSQPSGVALDPAAGRIYWANAGGNRISFAALDGSGGDDLVTTGATVNNPIGVAVDPAAGRIYWANAGGNRISFAGLDGSGGGDLVTTGATVDFPAFPALLERPGGAGAPLVSGGSAVGATLSCSTGEWAPDLAAALLYRAPRSFAYAWSRDGATIAGAATSSLTASDPGAYRCQVTATNQAGSATQTSEPHSVAAAPAPALVGPPPAAPPPAAPPPAAPPPAAPALPAAAAFGARTLVALELAARRIPAAGPLPVRVANGNDFTVTGVLSGQTAGKVTVSPRKPVMLKAKSFSLAAHARTMIKLALPKPLRRLLQRQHKLALRLTAKPKDPAGNTRTVTKRVTPKLKRKRGR
jgi:hypothetical protein